MLISDSALYTSHPEIFNHSNCMVYCAAEGILAAFNGDKSKTNNNGLEAASITLNHPE